MTSFCLYLQGRVILEKLSLSVALSGRAIFYSALHRGYISQYILKGEYWVNPSKRGGMDRVFKGLAGLL